MLELPLQRDPNAPLQILCLGAHSDDIEIGCGGTILRLTRLYPRSSVCWVVFSAEAEERQAEALASATVFLERAAEKRVVVQRFRESFFPFVGTEIKEYFEELKASVRPDLVFTHHRQDLHQDHRTLAEFTWNTFRSSLILEYEIPKWDGDLGRPNCYVPIPEDLAELKIRSLLATFASQRTRSWFTDDTFRGLMRLRGVESNTRFAEAFHARKLLLGGPAGSP
jgi:LmbE family N-acetylglucosaminyl deacetylase